MLFDAKYTHRQTKQLAVFFTARRYSAVYAVRPSACPPVCPSQTGTVPTRLKVGPRKERHTIAQGL